jgi:hypothetical protein
VLSKAEIKPVEPEQDNACEGKVTAISAPLLIATFLFPVFLNLTMSYD